MFMCLPHRRTHPTAAVQRPGARLRRLIAILAVATGSLLVWASMVPAAFARTPPGVEQIGPVRPAPMPTPPVRLVVVGGMPGWQISLIALGAALVAAAAAVVLDRALGARRAVSTQTA